MSFVTELLQFIEKSLGSKKRKQFDSNSLEKENKKKRFRSAPMNADRDAYFELHSAMNDELEKALK